MIVILQLVAMWLVVGTTVVWFLRDEKRISDAALSAQALRFAKVPHYRHPAPEEPAIFGL